MTKFCFGVDIVIDMVQSAQELGGHCKVVFGLFVTDTISIGGLV
jgi:hypothetical protein